MTGGLESSTSTADCGGLGYNLQSFESVEAVVSLPNGFGRLKMAVVDSKQLQQTQMTAENPSRGRTPIGGPISGPPII